MPPNVLHWLQELDQLGWETPADFNYYEALGEVTWRKPYIESILKLNLEMDTCVQDASHFTELTSFTEAVFDPNTGSNVRKGRITLRYSSFGRMVAVGGYELEKWDADLPALYKYLEDSNYTVMGAHILDEPYTGTKIPGATSLTWYGRFFDYL